MCLSQNAMLGVNLVKIRSVIQTLELPADRDIQTIKSYTKGAFRGLK